MTKSNLPLGIGPEESPLLDFRKNPHGLFKHLLRYFFVADQLMERLFNQYSANWSSPTLLDILDVGCGNAEMFPFISSYVRPKGYSVRYQGIDGDPKRVKRARETFPSLDIKEAFLPEGLEEYAGTVFQGIICSEVYEHLTPEEGRRLLASLLKIAQKETITVFTVPTPKTSRYRQNPLHLNEIWPKEFIYTAGENGWSVTHWFWLRKECQRYHPNVPLALSSPLISPGSGLDGPGMCALYVLRRNDYAQ